MLFFFRLLIIIIIFVIVLFCCLCLIFIILIGWFREDSVGFRVVPGRFRVVPARFRVVPAGSGWVPRFTYTHLCEVFENCSIRLSNDRTVFTRPLTIYKSSESINSALFSRANPLRSPRLVKLNSFNFDQKRCNTHRKVFAPFLFIAFARKMIPFIRFSLKLRSFLSLFFLQIMNYVS